MVEELTNVLKREHGAVKKCHICFTEFRDPENIKVRDHCNYTDSYRRATPKNCNLKYWILYHTPAAFQEFLSSFDVYLFTKFNKDDIGVIAEDEKKYLDINVKINVKLAGEINMVKIYARVFCRNS